MDQARQSLILAPRGPFMPIGAHLVELGQSLHPQLAHQRKSFCEVGFVLPERALRDIDMDFFPFQMAFRH